MREHVWIIDGHPIAVRLKDGTPQVAHELPDPMRPADEGWHNLGGAHTLEDDFAIEILCLAEENDRHIARIRELESVFARRADMRRAAPVIAQGISDRDARIAALEAHLDGIRKLLRSECADLNAQAVVRLEAAVLAHARAADEASQSKRGAVIESRDAERARVRRELLAKFKRAEVIWEGCRSAIEVDDVLAALDDVCPEG